MQSEGRDTPPRYSMLFPPFFLLFSSTCLHPRLQGGPELCDWHYTQHRERQSNGPPISPFHLPFLIVFLPSSIFPFTQLSNYHRADEGQKDSFPALKGSEIQGGGWPRWLTRSILQVRKVTPGNAVSTFFLLVCCVCVCVCERDRECKDDV